MVFLSELYHAFRRVNGYAMSAVGVVLSALAHVWLPDAKLSIGVIVPITVVVVLLVLTLLDAVYEGIRRRACLPKVVRAFPPKAPYADARAILLLEESDIFSHDAMVSVFSRIDEFERFIGVGFVATVQENGLIQVCVQSDPEDSNVDTWDRILQNNRDELAQLLVKPSIPRTLRM